MFGKLFKAFKAEIGFTYITSAATITSILGAAFYFYFAALVSVETYGKINFLISSTMVAFAISALGMDNTVMTFVPKRSIQVLFEANSLLLISAIFAAILTGIFVNNFTASILVLGTTFYFMSLVELLTRKRYKEYVIVSVGGKVIQIVLSLGLYFTIGIHGFVLGYAMAYLLFGYRFVFSLRNFKLKFDQLKTIWKFIGQVYGANTSFTLTSYLDKIIVGIFFGYYILGSYYLSFQVFSFISLLPMSLFNYLLPHEAGGVIKRKIKILGFAIAASVSLTIILITPYAIPTVYPKYEQSIQPIQIISLAIIPLTFDNMLRTKILSEEKRTHHLLYAGLITIVSEILLLLLLGSILGLKGLALSVVIALTIQFSYLFFTNRRKIF